MLRFGLGVGVAGDGDEGEVALVAGEEEVEDALAAAVAADDDDDDERFFPLVDGDLEGVAAAEVVPF